MSTEQNKKLGSCVIALLIMACFIPVIAGASPLGHGRQDRGFNRVGHHRPALGIWQDQKMIQNLELTKEQVKQIRDADFTFREKLLQLKAQLDGFRLQMDKSFTAEVVDDRAILSLAQKMSDAKGKLFLQKVQSRLALAKILNEDQVAKLKSLDRPEKKCGPRNDRKHMTGIGSIERFEDKKPYEN